MAVLLGAALLAGSCAPTPSADDEADLLIEGGSSRVAGSTDRLGTWVRALKLIFSGVTSAVTGGSQPTTRACAGPPENQSLCRLAMATAAYFAMRYRHVQPNANARTTPFDAYNHILATIARDAPEQNGRPAYRQALVTQLGDDPLLRRYLETLEQEFGLVEGGASGRHVEDFSRAILFNIFHLLEYERGQRAPLEQALANARHALTELKDKPLAATMLERVIAELEEARRNGPAPSSAERIRLGLLIELASSQGLTPGLADVFRSLVPTPVQLHPEVREGTNKTLTEVRTCFASALPAEGDRENTRMTRAALLVTKLHEFHLAEQNMTVAIAKLLETFRHLGLLIQDHDLSGLCDTQCLDVLHRGHLFRDLLASLVHTVTHHPDFPSMLASRLRHLAERLNRREHTAMQDAIIAALHFLQKSQFFERGCVS